MIEIFKAELRRTLSGLSGLEFVTVDINEKWLIEITIKTSLGTTYEYKEHIKHKTFPYIVNATQQMILLDQSKLDIPIPITQAIPKVLQNEDQCFVNAITKSRKG